MEQRLALEMEPATARSQMRHAVSNPPLALAVVAASARRVERPFYVTVTVAATVFRFLNIALLARNPALAG
jgi:cell division protein FtsL